MMPAWMKQRTMTHTQYQAAIDRLGLSQLAAGRFLGVSKNTAQRYASGDTEIPVPTMMLLRWMVAEGIMPE